MSGDRGPRVGLWIKGAYRSGLEKRCAMWEDEGDDFNDIVAMAHRELASARHKADNIIANAQTQATCIVEEAEFVGRRVIQDALEQADRIKERASRRAADEILSVRAKALEDGKEASRILAQEELQQKFETALGILEKLEYERSEYLKLQGDAMIDFAFALATRTIGVAREVLPDLLSKNLRQLLADPALVGESLRLFVHPSDAEEIRRLSKELQTASLRVECDADVKVGSCRVRGEVINLDLNFDERFARLRQEVLLASGRLKS